MVTGTEQGERTQPVKAGGRVCRAQREGGQPLQLSLGPRGVAGERDRLDSAERAGAVDQEIEPD
jgi:hypothetical protein